MRQFSTRPSLFAFARGAALCALAVEACAVFALAACKLRSDGSRPITNNSVSAGTRQIVAESASQVAAGLGYPKGPWRIDRSSVNNVAFPLEHIRISHQHIKSNPLFFQPDEPASRTRDEAARLAISIAQQASRDPTRFQELARKYSDDNVTKPWGGALGLVRATMLPTEVVDSMYYVRPGEVSTAIETAAGFEVVHRLPLGKQVSLSASQILVKYKGCEGWPRGGREITRSRDQARELAQRIATEARSQRTTFSKLVSEYSDAYDIGDSGDIGLISTYSATILALPSLVISQLKIGEVSEPVETPQGFSVYRRSEVTDRQVLAASQILITHDLVQGGNASRDRSTALKFATKLNAELSRNPRLFADYQRRYCELGACQTLTRSWKQGADLDAIENALMQLDIGGVAPEPIESPMGFFIVKREDPATVASFAEQLTFEPPRPPLPRFEDMLDKVPGDNLAFMLRGQAKAFRSQKIVADAQLSTVDAVIDELATKISAGPAEERAEAYARAQEQLRRALAPSAFTEYELVAQQWLRDFLMQR